jgi:hypothetical protein
MPEQAAIRLLWLQRQITSGWHLIAPVIERPARQENGEPISTFEFVLRNERGCQAVVVRDCPEVRAFLRDRELDSIVL